MHIVSYYGIIFIQAKGATSTKVKDMIYSMARLNERGMVIGNITELKSNRKLKKGDKVMIKIGLSGAKAAFTILGRIH